jgi:hypothetical protein
LLVNPPLLTLRTGRPPIDTIDKLFSGWLDEAHAVPDDP